FKGLGLLRRLKKAGIPRYTNARNVRIEGDGAVEAVVFTVGRRNVRLGTTAVALHQGVVPNQQITRLLRCEHVFVGRQRCFAPKVDEFYETSVANVFAVGDGAGIAGAVSAELRGRLAALRIAGKAGKDVSEQQVSRLQSALKRDFAVRPFLDMAYPPAEQVLDPDDDVVVCRCEEITAGQIRDAVDLGAPGPNQVKSYLRCGMGACQGRVCGLPVTEIIAAERNQTPADVDYFRIRPPLKPIPLADLATLDPEEVPLDPV
ncbi:MAG: NAD(P)/FAD-dependent oxidoreductase, partial [Methylobacteriaceae bacterium]|nr:NAD(P)/FAD-dependent oxidoreductase [Methylobacteriaceae bacterium]